jgi:hypothetical protein
MPYKIHIFNNEKLIVVNVYGNYTLEEAQSCRIDIAESPEFQQNYNILKDYRSAILKFSHDDVKDIHRECQEKTPAIRICHLESSSKGAAMAMLFKRSINKPILFDVFSTVEAASDFLRVPNLEELLKETSINTPKPTPKNKYR